jgi:hypothetical protein
MYAATDASTRIAHSSIRPKKSPTGAPPQEGRADQRHDNAVTHGGLKIPEAHGLLRRQPQARHFDELTAHTIDEDLKFSHPTPAFALHQDTLRNRAYPERTNIPWGVIPSARAAP